MVSRDWWIRYRQNAAIEAALLRSYSRHFWAAVGQHVKKGSFPASWTKLREAMHIAQGTDHRKRTGEYKTTYPEMLGIATLLGIEPGTLVPASRKWLISATRELCRQSEQSDIELFVDYCLLQALKHRNRGEGSLGDWKTEESDVDELICSVEPQADVATAKESIDVIASQISRRLEGAQ